MSAGATRSSRRCRPAARRTSTGAASISQPCWTNSASMRARFLWSFGLDGGSFADETCDWFVKDLPLARLQAGSVLIAYELNGAPLPPEHGFPARLVVLGYYGT